jgi:hypothetical protein
MNVSAVEVIVTPWAIGAHATATSTAQSVILRRTR